jgi:cytochrome c-type biogenesis protein CcmE
VSKKKTKFVIAALIIFVGIAGLIFTSMQGALASYMKPSELLKKVAKDKSSYNERVRVGGIVVTKTLKGSGASRKWEFMITDDRNGKIEPIALSETKPNNRLIVKYEGIAPDTLDEGVIAIADGTLRKDGVFIADNVLAKCPSKYEQSKAKAKAKAETAKGVK